MISYGEAEWKRKKRMEDGQRDRKEPRQTMQKKNKAPSNNQLKSQKWKTKKKKLQPRKLSTKENRIRGD
jgi:hypothetical protein